MGKPVQRRPGMPGPGGRATPSTTKLGTDGKDDAVFHRAAGS